MKNDVYSAYSSGPYADEIDNLTCGQTLKQENRKSALQWRFLSTLINLVQISKKKII
jgi:hypothetical protein